MSFKTKATLKEKAIRLCEGSNWELETVTPNSVIHWEPWETIGLWSSLEEATEKAAAIDEEGWVMWEHSDNDIAEIYEEFMLRMLESAIEIARIAHEGQVDKSGVDYINHPLTVMSFCETIEAKIVAALHDVIEDTHLTVRDLIEKGVASDLAYKVNQLSREKGTPYLEYVESLKGDAILEEVKRADLKHNMDLSRLLEVTEKDLKRVEKYKKALTLLTENK